MRIPYALGALAILLLALSFVFSLAIIGAIAFIVVFGYVTYVRYRLSPRGGDLQAHIRELVLYHLEWDGEGRALDIGCGNAALLLAWLNAFPPRA